MGDWHVGSAEGEKIDSVGQMFGRFSGEVCSKMGAWQERLHRNPADLELLEQEVRSEFMRGADLMVAGLTAVVMASDELAASSERTRQSFEQPLSQGRKRSIQIRMLGGMVFWVSSLYCEPRKRVFRKQGDGARGVYIELEQFGFGKAISPGLESRVSRQAALCPSFELTQMELERDGVSLDVKTVRRIAQQCGENLLRLRTSELAQWRRGELASTDELAGQRVSVQIDGGRTKLRGPLRPQTPGNKDKTDAEGLFMENAPGRSKQQAARTFDGEWREPKLLTIFVHDENGRMTKKTQATMDGSFSGPDALAELTAMHLHRLGAAKAASITFVADGAVWIWDRIASILKQAGIPDSVPTHQVLDNCHAVHHVSKSLATLGLTQEERLPLYRELRSQLRNGQWRLVIEKLEGLVDSERTGENAAFETELNYLRKHGAAGRLSYTKFRGLGLPLGSGAIESSIRRVINQRLKSNGTFWLAEGAESMLQLRCLLITNRWDERIQSMRAYKRTRHIPDWKWAPADMASRVERKFDGPIST